MRCELDTSFGADGAIFTRANAGEVLPALLYPLGWSLIGPGFEEAFRISLCDDLRAVDRPACDYALTGRFAGYWHLNLTTLRVAAERLPGTSAHAVDVQYFGDAAAHGLPAHHRSRGDMRRYVKTGPGAARSMLGFDRRLARLVQEVDAAVARNKAFVASGPSDVELVDALAPLAELFARVGGAHVTGRALTSSALDTAQRVLARYRITGADALALVSSIPDLESAKPSRALSAIAVEIDPASPPTADELRDAIEAFLDEFGHRGVNEFDPTVPAWEQQPDAVVAQVVALIGEPVRESADVPAAPRLARPLVRNAQSWMRRAERTKSTTVRVSHEMRRIVFALADRWSERVSFDDLRLLTIDEVRAIAEGQSIPIDAIARRRAELDAAATVRPKEWSRGELQVEPVVTDGESDATQIEGIGGSPGVATGRVRVLRDPGDEIGDGDILVAALTDTAWTPLFLVAEAVVTDVGGLLSHATIVARDLGIPAVVNTKTATIDLRDGDLVEVDGSRGLVRILERA